MTISLYFGLARRALDESLARVRAQFARGPGVGHARGHAAGPGDLFGQAVLDLDEFGFAHSCAFMGLSSMSMSD